MPSRLPCCHRAINLFTFRWHQTHLTYRQPFGLRATCDRCTRVWERRRVWTLIEEPEPEPAMPFIDDTQERTP